MGARTLLAALAILLLPVAEAQAAALLVRMHTDLEPGLEFRHYGAWVRTASGATVRAWSDTAEAGEDFSEGVMIGSLTVPEGDYTVETWLRLFDGTHLARNASFHVGPNGHGSNIFLTTSKLPSLPPVYKLDSLYADNDGSGTVSPGDDVRYTLYFPSLYGLLEGTQVHDSLPPGSALVPGSVTTTHGTVVVGNVPGDEEITVSTGDVPPGSTVTIRYVVKVAPVIANQASVTMVSYGGFPLPQLSDDPETEALVDPTLTVLQCPGQQGGQCCGPLDECLSVVDGVTGELKQCSADLGMCQQEAQACVATAAQLEKALGQAQAAIDELTADPDMDGVIAARDDCPETPCGEEVDANGCSRDEFCRSVPTDGANWKKLCRRSDWKNDEPLLDKPKDCEPDTSEGACVED